MPEHVNGWLVAGGMLSGAAALFHLACIWGGASWYRMMGAGEKMARAVGRGAQLPHVITICITAVLLLWTAYAMSGAGLIVRLPMLRTVLVAVACIYLARAAAFPIMIRTMPDRSRAFLLNSSILVLVIGIVHAVGIATAWPSL